MKMQTADDGIGILAGCPFCGGKAYWIKGNHGTRMIDQVSCYECDVTMEGDYTPMSAVIRWNSRSSDNQVYKGRRKINITGENL